MKDNLQRRNRGTAFTVLIELISNERSSAVLILIATLALTLPAATTAAEIYTFVDENGVRHLSNIPDDARYRRIKPRSHRRALRPGNPEQFALSIRKVARTVGLEPALIYAVVQAESAFDPNAVSSKGAVGLMQLMPGTARRYGVENRRDPMQNLHGGARYLRDLLQEFRDLRLALAAYNAGENAVRKYGNAVPPYAETQQYVRRVQRFYQRFRTSG